MNSKSSRPGATTVAQPLDVLKDEYYILLSIDHSRDIFFDECNSLKRCFQTSFFILFQKNAARLASIISDRIYL